MRVCTMPGRRGCAVVAANWAGGGRSEAWCVSGVKIGALVGRLIPREVSERSGREVGVSPNQLS